MQLHLGRLTSLAAHAVLWCVCARIAVADEHQIAVPKVPGLIVEVGETVLIQRDAWFPVVHQFGDGRISVGWGYHLPKPGTWSADGGLTWQQGDAPPDRGCIELGNGELLSLSATTAKGDDGKHTAKQRRSLDNWKTVTEEIAVFDIPRAVPCGGDGGEINGGFIADHAIIRLKDGRLMASMYGNYEDDKTPARDFPADFKFNKYRTIVVFSSDKGKTWADPTTVAAATEIAQEGMCEADLARAPNGDILCVMRSGGKPGVPPSPCYLCRSLDEGKTWSKPTPILDRGVWPNLCVMKNGTIVCTTGRPGNWMMFSSDSGRSWNGAFCFHEGAIFPSVTCYIVPIEVAPNKLLVIYDRDANQGKGDVAHEIVGTFFTVKKK